MQCPACKQSLRIGKSRHVSDINSTEVYSELDMVCINKNCSNYAGDNLSSPKKIVQTVRNKVN